MLAPAARAPNAEDLEKWVANAMQLPAVAQAGRGLPVGVVRFDTSLADIPKAGPCTGFSHFQVLNLMIIS